MQKETDKRKNGHMSHRVQNKSRNEESHFEDHEKLWFFEVFESKVDSTVHDSEL